MSLKSVKTLTAAQIAKKWDLPIKTVLRLIDDGAKVEFEHDKDLKNAKQIARDHLSERPDYYKKVKKMEKTKITKVNEESGVEGIRGFGNVTGDPATTGNSYVDSNALSYEDENGNKFAWIKKYTSGHNVVGFNEFNPTELTKKVKLKEGISAGPEREIPIIGDLTGSSRKVMKVDEIKLPPRVKKAAATGMTIANLYTAGDVASRAQQGEGHPVKDVIAAASTLPGTKGWAAYAADKAGKAYDYVRKNKQMKEEKGPCWKGYEMVGMKKKSGRKVPNCVPVEEQGSPANPARYTERPMYEKKNDISSGEVERGIYEGNKLNKLKKRDWQDPKKRPKKDEKWDPRDMLSGVHRGRKVAEESEQIDELKAETLGSYIKKAAASRKKSLVGPKPDIKTWSKRQQGIGKAFEKLTKEDLADKDWDDTTGKKLPENHNKPDTRYAPGATGITKTIHEETTMDTKELVNEAIDNILDNNLVDMKENLLAALQEKAMQKLEEKKKDIASNYFAQ